MWVPQSTWASYVKHTLELLLSNINNSPLPKTFKGVFFEHDYRNIRHKKNKSSGILGKFNDILFKFLENFYIFFSFFTNIFLPNL